MFDSCLAVAGTTAPVDDTTGEFTDVVILGATGGLDYSVGVMGLDDYYLTTAATTSVTATTDPAAVNLTVSEGGVIAGTVYRAAGGAGLPNIPVSAGGGAVLTDVDGTYEIHLPAGTYDMLVGGGALTEGVTVTAGETTTMDFARGPYSGFVYRAEDNQGIEWATFAGTAAGTTDDDGFFTLEFYEGINWVCVNPNSAIQAYNVEYRCFYDIPVTAADLDD